MINILEYLKKLGVWKKSTELVVEIYRLVKKLPKEELYSLSDQMRRAAVSIPSNIAEGRNRDSDKEYVRFLYIARGSLGEIQTQLYICVQLGYLKESDTDIAFNLCEEVGKMLNTLISKINYELTANS